jgi:hypothetical protein
MKSSSSSSSGRAEALAGTAAEPGGSGAAPLPAQPSHSTDSSGRAQTLLPPLTVAMLGRGLQAWTASAVRVVLLLLLLLSVTTHQTLTLNPRMRLTKSVLVLVVVAVCQQQSGRSSRGARQHTAQVGGRVAGCEGAQGQQQCVSWQVLSCTSLSASAAGLCAC